MIYRAYKENEGRRGNINQKGDKERESDIFHWLKQVTRPHLTGRGSPAMYPEEGETELSGE